MGEATFYLKAEFKNEGDAKIAEKIGEVVLNELNEFNNKFQSIRDNINVSIADRIGSLLDSYPLIEEFFDLPSIKKSDVVLNELAGWNEIEKDNQFDFRREENILYLSNEIWHFSNWDGICHLFEKLGAIKTGYASDEYIDVYKCIDMYKSDITPLKEEKLKEIIFEILL